MMHKNHFIGLIVVAAACVGVVALFFLPGSSLLSISSTPLASSTPVASGREVPAGYAEYYNPQYHLSLIYPAALKMTEHPEEGGAMTVTFEQDDNKTVEGFQIFIVPYAGGQITDERFKADVPSGVRTGLKNITIDDAVGASFYSTDAELGDTAELWLIHGGYLYEMTTFKELSGWLGSIAQTIQFLP